MAQLDRYRINIPRELSEIHTQPWLSEGSLTCDLDNVDSSYHASCYSKQILTCS